MAPPPGGGAVTVVEFALTDPRYPFVGLSRDEDCQVSLQKILPREDGEYAEFFKIVGADPDSVLAACGERDGVETSLLRGHDDGGLFEFVVGEYCPVQNLTEGGAIPTEVRGEEGRGEIVVEIPESVDTGSLLEKFLADHPGAELVAKWETDELSSLLTPSELQSAVSERLTDRQQEVLRTAYESGYYDTAGETSGADLGKSLGITASTVSQHLQAAERELVFTLFEAEAGGEF